MWSYLLSAIGITGLYLAGSKKRIGWMVGFLAQGFWIAYALSTKQYGFCLSAFAYAWVYARNWWRARPDPQLVAMDRRIRAAWDEAFPD